MELNNKINFRQGKYILPAILYLPLLFAGYFIIDIFNIEIKDKKDKSLVETEYLNADLPKAHVKADLGDKMSNMKKSFGNVKDLSAMQNIANDRDSLRKKEEYQSKYNEKDRALLDTAAQRKAADEAAQKVAAAGSGSDLSYDEFMRDLTDEERANIKRLQDMGRLDLVEKQLGLPKGQLAILLGANPAKDEKQGGEAAKADSTAPSAAVTANYERERRKHRPVEELADDADGTAVVKKVDSGSAYFHTVSDNEETSRMITAIIDEEVKAVDGTRVRLRLLDDVTIDDVPLQKGTYLYATMSGFSKQRVNGTVSSVMVKDDIVKINLSIYDTDGMKGLYVPESQFRETVKDIGGSALSSTINTTEGMDRDNSVTQWASNAIRQATSRTTQAISKLIKKNRVRLKYGTKVYLVNGKDLNRKRKN